MCWLRLFLAPLATTDKLGITHAREARNNSRDKTIVQIGIRTMRRWCHCSGSHERHCGWAAAKSSASAWRQVQPISGFMMAALRVAYRSRKVPAICSMSTPSGWPRWCFRSCLTQGTVSSASPMTCAVLHHFDVESCTSAVAAGMCPIVIPLHVGDKQKQALALATRTCTQQ